MNPKEIGNQGEEIAVNYLKKRGYKILERNFENKWGEIDVIAKKKGVVVFCEVKTIKKREGFAPEDEIGPKKKNQLLKMARIYLSSKKIPFETSHQIDIIAIELSDKDAKIRHIENTIEDNY